MMSRPASRFATLALSALCAAALVGPASGAARKPSPNTRVVFHGFNTIRTISPDGGPAKTLFAPGGLDIADVAASTNGKRIAAVTTRINSGPGGGLIRGISVFRGDGSHRQQAVAGSTTNTVNSVAITSDGKSIVYPFRSNLYIQKIGSKGKRRVTATSGHYKNPAISRDGKFVAYENNTSGRQDIYVQRMSGGPATRITHLPFDSANPSFSPDGKFVAYASDRSGGILHIVRSNGNGDKALVSTGTGEDAAPTFSPGGGALVYVGKRSGDFRLFTVRTDGTHRKIVNANVGAKDPQWTRLP